jgi:hypothetical protein
MLKRINSKDNACGISIGNRIKTKVVDGKLKSVINKIIYIVPKKDRQIFKGPNNQAIDWSHQWEVRGHWRKCSTIGKDRDGKYLVSGFTWVKDHVKGPEQKDLVIKTRVFKTENTNQKGEHNEYNT